jgi:hypothetical protein
MGKALTSAALGVAGILPGLPARLSVGKAGAKDDRKIEKISCQDTLLSLYNSI